MRAFIIIFLSLLCLFLAMHSLGFFRFGQVVDNEHFDYFAKQRVKAVERSREWKIGVAGDESSSMGKEVSSGVSKAASLVNAEGGVKGGKLVVSVKDAGEDFARNKLVTQEFCDRMDTAFFIGAMLEVQVKTTRALTQFQALPALTPISPLSRDMEPLSPDTFNSLYAPFDVIMPPLIDFLKARNYRNILIVSTPNIYDGGILAMDLANRLTKDAFFQDVFRVNYSPPAQEPELYQSLKVFQENRNFDAIVFTDSPADLKTLGLTMRALRISIPVIGLDALDVSDLASYAKDFPSSLYVAKYSGSLLSKEIQELWLKEFGAAPKTWEQYGAVSCFVFRDAMNSLDSYDPVALSSKIRELIDARLKSKEYVLSVDVVKFDPDAGK